jgi:hypothetical protein
LSQDRDKRRALANMVVNSWLHKMQGIFWLAEELAALQEELCSIINYFIN